MQLCIYDSLKVHHFKYSFILYHFRVSSYLTLNNIVTLICVLKVTRGHSK